MTEPTTEPTASQPTQPEPKVQQPSHSNWGHVLRSWRQWLRHPTAWFFITLIISQIVEKLVTTLYPNSIDDLYEVNEKLASWAAELNPWLNLGEFWNELMASWPSNPLQVPIHLIYGSFHVGFKVIISSFYSKEEPGKLLPPEIGLASLIGYAAGLYLTYNFHSRPVKGLNPIVGVVGTIFYGSLFLAVLQPMMLVSTAVFERLLNTVSGGLGSFAGLAVAGGKELSKKLLEGTAEKRLAGAIGGQDAHQDVRQSDVTVPWRSYRTPLIIAAGVICFVLFRPSPKPAEIKELTGTTWIEASSDSKRDTKLELEFLADRRIICRSPGYSYDETHEHEGTWEQEGAKVSAEFASTPNESASTLLFIPVRLEGTIKRNKIEGYLEKRHKDSTTGYTQRENFVVRRVEK